MKLLIVLALLVATVAAGSTREKRQYILSDYGYPAATVGYGYPVYGGLFTYGYGYPAATVGYGYAPYGGVHVIGKRSTDEHTRAKRQVFVGAYPSYGYGLAAATYGYPVYGGVSSYGYGYPAATYGYGYPAYGGLVYGKK